MGRENPLGCNPWVRDGGINNKGEIPLLGAGAVETQMAKGEVSACAVETRQQGKILRHVQ